MPWLRSFGKNAAKAIGAIRRAVAEHHELQVYAVVLLKTASLPKTTSGKVKRHACQVGFLDGTLKQVGQWKLELKGDRDERKHNRQPINLSSAIHSREAIQLWLKEAVADRLNLSPEEIDIRKSFMDYGLDSFQVATVSGDLSEWLQYRFSPTLLQDYNSIESLSRYLAVVHDVKQRLIDRVSRLQAAIKRVLSEDSYKQNAIRLQEAIRRAGGVSRAADIVEQVISSETPVLAKT